MKFLGAPYPIIKHPRGLLRTQSGIDQVKSDLLSLLLTTPGERVMLPNFGTPLKEVMFDPNDPATVDRVREMLIKSISTWEPRVTIDQIEITGNFDERDLNPEDDTSQKEHILGIKIRFYDPNNISDIQELKLEIPLSGE
jgi:phage baseplate assembly protein W